MHPIERLRSVARASGVDQQVLVRETASALGAFASDPQGLVTACRRIVSRQPSSGPLWWLTGRMLVGDDAMAEAWSAAEQLDADPTWRALCTELADEATVCVVGWPDVVGRALARRGDLRVLVVDSLGDGPALVSRLSGADGADGDAVDVSMVGLGAAAAASDLVLLEASAVGPSEFCAAAGSHAAAAVGRVSDATSVWLVAGVGRLVPARVWEVLAGRVEAGSDPWDADEELVPLSLVDRVVGPEGPEAVEAALERTDCPVAPELFRDL